MNPNNSLDFIIKAIQGKNEKMYTEEEVRNLNVLLDKAMNFYPKNKQGETEVNKLCEQIKKLQKQILDYDAAIINIVVSDISVTKPQIDELKRQYDIIQLFEFKIYDIFGDLELKYS